MPWTEEEAQALLGKSVRALTDLHAPSGVSGYITQIEYGDVSGWLCCIRWMDGSYSWIGQDDMGVNVTLDG